MGDAMAELRPASRLSPQQLDIANFVDAGKGNLLVVARAGTGKTTLIRQCLPLMVGPVAIAAYNSKIAEEIDSKVRADGNRADVATFHSFGRRALSKAFPKSKIDKKGAKFAAIADDLQIAPFMRSFVRKAASLAMQRGFGVFHPLNEPRHWLDMVDHFGLDTEISDDNVIAQIKGRHEAIKLALKAACKVVKRSIEMVDEIMSFDDMLYVPLVLNAKFDEFAWVCVDEAQDSNPVRREIAKRMTRRGGRMLWVGDDRQAIYGFTGADNDALDQIAQEFRCRRFPMTMTFRCGKAIVDVAKRLVPDYQAAESNQQGLVRVITDADFVSLSLKAGQDAIICRNTAPLVRCAYRLIAGGTAAHVEGKLIGEGLLALVNRWRLKDVRKLKERLHEYRQKEVQKLLADKKEQAAEALTDKIDTINALMETLPPGATVDTLKADINSMFQDTPDGQRSSVALMTAHRSKGLEFDRVFGWGVRQFFPSRFAKKPWQLRQEENLEYVLYTRAIRELVIVDVVAPKAPIQEPER